MPDQQFAYLLAAVPSIRDASRLLLKCWQFPAGDSSAKPCGAEEPSPIDGTVGWTNGTAQYIVLLPTEAVTKSENRRQQFIAHFRHMAELAETVLSQKSIETDQATTLLAGLRPLRTSLAKIAEQPDLESTALELIFHTFVEIEGPTNAMTIAWGELLWQAYRKEGQLIKCNFLAEWSHSLTAGPTEKRAIN
jgi:hypothetical protein